MPLRMVQDDSETSTYIKSFVSYTCININAIPARYIESQ